MMMAIPETRLCAINLVSMLFFIKTKAMGIYQTSNETCHSNKTNIGCGWMIIYDYE